MSTSYGRGCLCLSVSSGLLGGLPLFGIGSYQAVMSFFYGTHWQGNTTGNEAAGAQPFVVGAATQL